MFFPKEKSHTTPPLLEIFMVDNARVLKELRAQAKGFSVKWPDETNNSPFGPFKIQALFKQKPQLNTSYPQPKQLQPSPSNQ